MHLNAMHPHPPCAPHTQNFSKLGINLGAARAFICKRIAKQSPWRLAESEIEVLRAQSAALRLH